MPNPIRRRDFNLARRQEVVRLYMEEDRSQEEIAETFGVSRGRVAQYLRDMGVKPRQKFRTTKKFRENVALLERAAREWEVEVSTEEIEKLLKMLYEGPGQWQDPGG